MFAESINCFIEFSKQTPEVQALLLFGSVARGDATARSDLDLAIVTNRGSAARVTALAEQAFSTAHPKQVRDPRRPKLVLFSAELDRRVELFVVDDEGEVERYVRGSRLPDPSSAILYDRDGTMRDRVRVMSEEDGAPETEVDAQLRRFQLAFERGSRYHAASDAFRARFDLEIAHEALARAAWVGSGRRGFVFSPRYLLYALADPLRAAFARFENPADASRQHATKRALLEILRLVLQLLGRRDDELLAFCEKVIQRDRFWNYRDSAEHVDPRLRQGVLFRGASPHHHAGDPEFAAWIAAREIRTRVDLRAVFERERDPVHFDLPARYCPVDPWNELERWDPGRDEATPIERSYRFTALRCGPLVRDVAQTVLARHPVLIHCHAGRDRTGVVVGLLQYLVGIENDRIVHGFSLHADRERSDAFGRVLAFLDREGGARCYADRIGLTPAEAAAMASLLRRES